MEDKPDNDDYDSPWKTALDNYFQEFMLMYFPKAAEAISWEKGYESLDTELPSLVRDAGLGKRYADKLVKVYLKSGDTELLYIHTEVQGKPETGFEERMFVYYYRIRDRYGISVASMAVLADTRPNWRPAGYRAETLGCNLSFEFPIVKLTDYKDQIDNLLTSHNAFAIITAAHLLTIESRKDMNTRYRYKQKVVRWLYQKGWERQKVLDLFAAIDWMMHLPRLLTEQFRVELARQEQEMKMRYVTSIERLAREEGELDGLKKGKMEGKAVMLERLITLKFSACDDAARERLASADERQLDAWTDAILTADSVAELFSKGIINP